MAPLEFFRSDALPVCTEMSTLKAIHAAGGHENIARVLDVFEDPSSYVFVLELVSELAFFSFISFIAAVFDATPVS